MTRPFRIIPAETFPFDASHFYQTENCFCVRLLNKADKSIIDSVEVHPEEDLNTTNAIASKHLDKCISIGHKIIYDIKGEKYYIACEGIFDRKGYPWRKYWKPSANIFFYIPMRGDKTMHIAETSMLTAWNKLHTNINSFQEGYTVAAQLFCRSPEDTIPVVCKSMTGRPGHIFGNVDLGEARVQKPDEVNTIGASRYLNLSYIMTAPEQVKPNEEFIVKVEAVAGGTKEHAIVNYDNFNIDAVDGYVPHTRVALKNGYGEFRAMALGLRDGETMRLKFNRQHLTGMGECTILIKE